MMKYLKLPLLLSAICAVSPLAHADTTLTNVPSWNGSEYIQPWGPYGSEVYGETFVAPGNSLTSFTFYVKNTPGLTTGTQADVYAWNGNLIAGNGPQGTTGAALFESIPFTYTADGTFEGITITTGGVALTPGAQYVILLDALSGDGGAFWGRILNQVAGDGGGGMNFDNGGPAGTWDDFSNFGDLAYTATFTTTPEPSSIALLGTGLVGLLGVVRRRRAA